MTNTEGQMVELQVDAKALFEVYAASFDAMRVSGPEQLDRRLRFEAEAKEEPGLADPVSLIDYLGSRPPVGDRLLFKIRQTLADWDAEPTGSWTGETPPRSKERRRRIYDLLAVDAQIAAAFDTA
ncbi:MAG TPA: hypothetical protein VNM41_04885, partial [Solirubrobacterales bacterium]|nr:hypothetical protein [Solirubrobacterales bacterium]